MSNHDWLTHLKNSPVAARNPHLFEKPKQKAVRKPRKDSKEVIAITALITDWCKKQGLELILEHKFHPVRKYRFDFAIPQLMVAIEYQGGVFMQKSGHSNAKGSTRDHDKTNLAQSMGWRVLAFNAINYKTVIQELEKFNE